MPVGPAYRPDPRHPALGDAFFDVVEPARFPQHVLRWRNDRVAADIGLDTLSDDAWVDHLARFTPLPSNLPEPLALRYHGHQFRHYNPDLGDGRGFLYAQVRAPDGRLLDLGTKGSGTTPWSRGGDGRLTLKGGVRELLATEQLQALGVPTSHTLSLVETGESLERHDEPSPTRAAVLVRLQHGHVRFGTFQRQAFLGQHAEVERLVAYTLATYFPDVDPGDAPAVAMLSEVVDRSAHLAAAWMNAGFVHGVLNTDNLVVTGDSFDYGPWRFVPRFDPRFVAAYFDRTGLYAYGRQPEAVLWNLHRLAEALLGVADGHALEAALEAFLPTFRAAWHRGMMRRLGLAPADPATEAARARTAMTALSATPMGFERFFFDGFGGAAARDRALGGPAAALWRDPVFADVTAWLWDADPDPQARLDHPYFQDDAPTTILIDEMEALWSPIDADDDWQPLMDHVERVRRMGEALSPAEPATS